MIIVSLISDFSDIKEASYNRLLVASKTDKLFSSFEWLNAWWDLWGNEQSFDPTVIKVDNDEGELVCLLPLYSDSLKIKRLIRINRIQFIGTNYQKVSTPRAEYLSFLVHKDYKSSVRDALDSLSMLNWGEFIARDIVKGDLTDLEINRWANKNSWLIRVIHTDTAYSINTRVCFNEYTKNLGANTRLKLFNRRKLLNALGEVALENYYPNKISDFFDLLHSFHQLRWGDTFSDNTLLLHQRIMNSKVDKSPSVELSVLKVNGRPESVVFNYLVGGKVYNISSGYNQAFHKKISLGFLHLGYLVEEAFASENISTFDFLAGNGKNSNYKARLATDTLELHSLQIVRYPVLRMLYNAHDLMKKVRNNLIRAKQWTFKV